ncbi:MAG: V-type ATP synthase subunit C [Alkalibacterium sp.]|uniref:V/A-type H+-transporting ATPase subunit C n=1 Tax=Alkalibacterium gilvum TaxID=1130080 RepID=A0A1H6QV60_9LACT|nr:MULTISPECIES: V-type ATP synthase subunit C [Alkalibacterium]MDN6193716.1 V-type ATP synthase subunit C [Alkalibacterium sp.]MDN6293064.1 V-type ATP synthase subunit C [Alkalibacterium sp.]MDN6294870.1 V-type ATP synthase subunit C [Alkalibacterium sp.]MDN6326527.1 V-type ATP synthase subunit C [Alkalibacterium sp.]MDN6385853.1 V-type ATP synthase subunit C [Alkalibacterium sp.]
MEDIAYSSSNVLIRVYENNLLTRAHFERMLTADSFEEAVNVLRETPYRNDVDRIKEDKNYDSMFMNELHETYDEMFDIVPNKELIELFGLRYAYHNLKVLFKEEITDQELDHLFIPIGRYPIAELRQAVRSGQSEVLPGAYMDSINEVKSDYDEYQNVQAVDIILDRRYFTHSRELAKETGEPGVLELIERYIDYNNLSTLVRGMKQNRTRNFMLTVLSSSGSIPKEDLLDLMKNDLSAVAQYYRKTNYRKIVDNAIDSETEELSTVNVDYETDNAYMEKMHEAKLESFGPMPVIAYLYAKETEVTNLRLILSGKENGLTADEIRERMRLNYA